MLSLPPSLPLPPSLSPSPLSLTLWRGRVNGEPAAGGLQVPLKPGDTLVFGESTRSYIVRERRSAIKAEVGSAPTHDQGAVRAEIDVPTPHTL